MKLVSLFTDFLSDPVNINKTRLSRLDASASAVQNFLKSSNWLPSINEFIEHGSWAHHTIIKPVGGRPFDADLIVCIDPVYGWSAGDYINSLAKVFRDSSLYSDKVKRWDVCVTLEYASDYKIDIAPCLVGKFGYDPLQICDRSKDEFRPTFPVEYNSWLLSADAYAGNYHMRKVVRLLKYLRDIKQTFSCKSVLLTTLVGYHVGPSDRTSSDFADVPTSLKTIIDRLDDWLQSNQRRPRVPNPSNQSEDFGLLWTEEQYGNFRTVIHRYREWIDDAFNEPDRGESISKWRRVFGDEFAAAVVIAEGRDIEASAVEIARDRLSVFAEDLVSLVRQIGLAAIPSNFTRLSYMERSRWRMASPLHFGIAVSTSLHDAKNGGLMYPVVDLTPLPPNNWVRFQAKTNTGLPLSSDYEVHWRITNTGEVAASRQDGLRGQFYKSDEPGIRWEQIEYRGVHFAEAFVVRKRDNLCVAKSGPLYVVVD